MAYQPKSYRKFLATSLTAAMVATAVAPAVMADSHKDASASFSDVSEGTTHYEEINYLFNQDVIGGFLDGTFRTGENLTRGQSTLFIARALGFLDEDDMVKAEYKTDDLSDYTFNDVSSSSAYYVRASLLKKEGIFLGSDGDLNVNDEVTRSEMALILTRAFDLEANGEVAPFTDKGASAAGAIDALYANEITMGFPDDTFRPYTDIKRGDFAAFVARAMQVEEVVVEPAVESVSAINGKELVVTFNEAVDSSDVAGKVSLVDGSAVAWDSEDLSKDGKVLTLTATGVIDVNNATLTVESIKTEADADVTTSKYVTLFTYSDTVAPSISKVEAQDKEAVITFNESIEGSTGLGVSVNGQNYSDVTISGKTLTINGLTDEETYSVEVVGAKDAADNVANPIDLNFTVAKADEPLAQGVSTSVDENKVTLSFVNSLSASNSATVDFVDGEAYNTGNELVLNGTAEPGVTYSEDKKTVVLDAQVLGVLSGLNFLNTDIVVSGAGLEEDTTVNATLTTDTTSAELVSSTTTVDGTLLLEFGEEVQVPGTIDLDVTHVDGIYQSTPIEWNGLSVAYATDNNNDAIKTTLEIDLGANYDVDVPYVVEVPGVVNDVYNNVTDKFTTTVEVPKEDEEEVVGDAIVTVGTNVADDVIELTFANTSDDKGVTSEALSASNYTLGGEELPEGTIIRYVDNKNNVEILLPSGSIKTTGTYVLTMDNITDEVGNTLAAGNSEHPLTIVENVAPTALDLSVNSSSEIVVTFSEAVSFFDIDGDVATVGADGDGIVEGITVKVNGTAVDATVAPGDVSSTLTIDGLALETSDTVTVEFADAEIADANDNLLVDGVAK